MTKPARALKRAARKSNPLRERHALVTWANSISVSIDAIAEYDPENDGPRADFVKGIIPIIISSSKRALIDSGGATLPIVLEGKRHIRELLDLTVTEAKNGALFADSVDDPHLVNIVKAAIEATKLVVVGIRKWQIGVIEQDPEKSKVVYVDKGVETAEGTPTTH